MSKVQTRNGKAIQFKDDDDDDDEVVRDKYSASSLLENIISQQVSGIFPRVT